MTTEDWKSVCITIPLEFYKDIFGFKIRYPGASGFACFLYFGDEIKNCSYRAGNLTLFSWKEERTRQWKLKNFVGIQRVFIECESSEKEWL